MKNNFLLPKTLRLLISRQAGLLLFLSSLNFAFADNPVVESPAVDPRPNILWITSEDNGCFLGCYGDEGANTPNLDALAARGVRYTNCYANAPVCAVARSGWITGVPAVTLGTHHMRSHYRIPNSVEPYPRLLREAGYYCTNHTKTDYNTRSFNKEIWDDGSPRAHFKNAPADKPFFAVVNFTSSHESQIFPAAWKDKLPPITPEASIKIPPYQVSTPENLLDWRRMYDRNTTMDGQVGELLKELADSGRADNTIVVYCADHGGITLRSKRFLYDSGTLVPLIVAVPPALQHLADGPPGSVNERLVQFMDMPSTWLSLAGVAVPEPMTGSVFLGADMQPAPETVYLFSNRFDESPEMRRGVTDGRWKYIRNYEPDRPRFQMLEYPWNQAGQRSQWREYSAGRTDPIQSAFYQSQPTEELYDTDADPHEIHNLATDPAYADRLTKMRTMLIQHALEHRDVGFVPEMLMAEIDSETTLFEWAASIENYPLAEILPAANLASERNPENLNRLIALLDSDNQIIRYWALLGLRGLGKAAQPAAAAVEKLTVDPRPVIRIPATIVLGNIASTESEKSTAGSMLINEAQVAEVDVIAHAALEGLKYLDLPEGIEGITKDAIVKGQYSERIFNLLKAGGSLYQPPKK